MDAISILDQLQATGAIPPVACLFVSHLSGAARHEDYTCNEGYSRFIAEDVVGWARRKCGSLAEAGHLICGLSLSGLASAYLALERPEVFAGALCQSGSFWWNEERLTQDAAALPASRGRFWLSVGDRETEAGISHPPTGMRQDVTQIAAAERMATALETIGATVHFQPFSGGHEIAPWREELPEALTWLLSGA